ncbi:MAG: hypothetical protein KDK27_13300, partial [Leptospiraceae bacterium]|nr:hypothetical protein [Leptospiraceae bacterium]
MDSLIRYASRRLLLHLAEHPYLPTEPNSLSFYSSIMFADMKDFTILAEQLTRNDPVEGVNTLAGYLDIYIGKLVEIITRHGGD